MEQVQQQRLMRVLDDYVAVVKLTTRYVSGEIPAGLAMEQICLILTEKPRG